LSCSFPPSLSSCVLRLLALHSFPTRRSSDLPPLVEQLSDSCYCYTQYDGCLERRTVDSCGNSMCLKTPQSGFLEEAEAVPAESNIAVTSQFIDFVSKTPIFEKRALFLRVSNVHSLPVFAKIDIY